MSSPVAYLLTWTTYGSWLHGDARGSVDAEHNVKGHPTLDRDDFLHAAVSQRMSSDAVVFGEREREIVADVIGAHCEHRGWRLHAVNARTNHVHVVVTCDVDPSVAMAQFKAWGTRRLRESGFVATDASVWTEHGSTRWINSTESLRAAIDYVVRHQ